MFKIKERIVKTTYEDGGIIYTYERMGFLIPFYRTLYIIPTSFIKQQLPKIADSLPAIKKALANNRPIKKEELIIKNYNT